VDAGLPGRVGGDQAALLEESQDVPGAGAAPVGGQGPDIGLVDRGLRADPGQQDPQAAGGDPAYLLVQATGFDVLPEVLQQSLGGRGEGRQLVQRALGEVAPVPAGPEQDALAGGDQVGRDRWCRRPAGGGFGPGLLLWRDVAELAGPHRQARGEISSQPQLSPRLCPRAGSVPVDVQAAGPAEPIQQGNSRAPAPGAVIDRVQRRLMLPGRAS